MPVVAGDILSLSVYGRIFNQRILMVRNYQCAQSSTGADTRTQLLAIGAAYKAVGGVVEKYLACLPDQYFCDLVRAQVVYPVRSTFADTQVSLSGTVSGEKALNQSAAAITLQTAKAGRSQRATIHLGPLSDISIAEDGAVTPGYVTLMNTLGAQLIQNVVSSGPGACTLTPIIYHRNGDGPLAKSDIVNAWTANDELRTMRRRVVGRGI